MNFDKKWFSLIELLVVIVLIWITSVIVFVNFGNQTPKARNAMRLDNSWKILKAFQLQQLEEKIPSNSCLSWSSEYTLTWTLSWTWCNVVLDGNSDSKSFLSKLKVSWSFEDPSNWKTINGDEFKYEFNYKLGGNQYEFAYLMEPKEEGSLINLNKTYALEYTSWSLNSINIDWSFSSPDSIITPIVLKDSNWTKLFSNLYQTWLINWKEKIISFNKSSEYTSALKNTLGSFLNNSSTGEVTENENSTDSSCFEVSWWIITNYSDSCSPIVTIPSTINGETITGIGNAAFIGSYVKCLSSEDQSVLNFVGDDCSNNGGVETNFLKDRQISQIEFPNTIISIWASAFKDNALTSLTLPNSLQTIGPWAFMNNKLASLTLPNSVTTVNKLAFKNNKLTNLILSSSLTKIPTETFSDNNLFEITIPYNINTIERNAFRWNYLKNITIEDYIPNYRYAFTNQKTAPSESKIMYSSVDSVKEIADYSWFQFVKISNGTCFDFSHWMISKYNYIEWDLNCSKSIVEIPSIINGQEVKEIGMSAFNSDWYKCLNIDTNELEPCYESGNIPVISKIKIPNTVVKIQLYAFANSMVASIDLTEINKPITFDPHTFKGFIDPGMIQLNISNYLKDSFFNDSNFSLIDSDQSIYNDDTYTYFDQYFQLLIN